MWDVLLSFAADKSKELLGHKHRLEVAAAIYAEAGAPFSALALSDAHQLRYPRVHEQLAHFLKIGMIFRVDTQTRDVEYKAAESIYWEMCSRLLTEINESS